MNQIRTFNVLTLASILLLAGCFGMGDSAEASDDHDHTPNAAPVLHAELMLDEVSSMIEFNQADCTPTECIVTVYHAAVDPDGDLIDLGYDFDLDGIIDYQLTSPRGITNLQIPVTEFIETVISVSEIIEESTCVGSQKLVITNTTSVTRMLTTIALIAVDSNDAASAMLLTAEMFALPTTSEASTEPCIDDYMFVDRDAAGTMGETTDDALVHVQMTQGDGLSYAQLKFSIVVDGGASYTCSTDATNECTIGEPADGDKSWDTSEEITISESGTDLCDGANGGCEVVVTLTKIGVGEEDDKVIATVTAYADAN